MTQLEHIFRVTGAYDGTSHPRNYGIGAMRLFFAVKGSKGGVSASLSTSWYLPQNQQSSFNLYSSGYPFDPLEQMMQPQWWDIGQHHKEPQYEDQIPSNDCEVTGGQCFCDGTSLWGKEEWMLGFLHGGSDWLFARLEEYYLNVFENGPGPNLTPIPRTFPE